MSINYKCHRCCKFETSNFNDIKKHYIRKYPCNRSPTSLLYSDDQILCLSLISYHDNIHNIDISEIQYLNKSNIINKNKIELLEELKNIEKNNIKICKHCDKEFSIISDLKKHFMIHCFYEKLKKIETEKSINVKNIETNVNGNYNNLYNNPEINTMNNNNNNNNINIFFDKTLKTPVPFDEEWDISKISNKEKTALMVSQYMYTELLEEILKNDTNLNVIIDNDKESAMVYKNSIDKYINMKFKDIVSNTMLKLNSHLNDINKSDKNTYSEIINFSRQMINKKYNDFTHSDTIQNGVKNCMTKIYDNKKEEAIDMAKNVIDKKNSINNEYRI